MIARGLFLGGLRRVSTRFREGRTESRSKAWSLHGDFWSFDALRAVASASQTRSIKSPYNGTSVLYISERAWQKRARRVSWSNSMLVIEKIIPLCAVALHRVTTGLFILSFIYDLIISITVLPSMLSSDNPSQHAYPLSAYPLEHGFPG